MVAKMKAELDCSFSQHVWCDINNFLLYRSLWHEPHETGAWK